MTDAPRRVLDAASLPGLAHPLRVQLLEQLTQYGPATATQLGARLHESSGATSYHLRQLERYGFVEEDPGRGSGRERWWRRVPGGLRINTPEPTDDAATKEATQLVVNEFTRGRNRRAEHWRETFADWPREWQDAGGQGTFHMRLTAAELDELSTELESVVLRWKQLADERQNTDAGVADEGGHRQVEIQLTTFPLPDPNEPRD